MQGNIRLGSRPNISESVATALRDMIFDGELMGGERINEVRLAARLGVSRTPLREALMKLVAEEALISVPRRGCFVRRLTRQEFEEIYPMRAILEPEALRRAGIPSGKDLKELARINQDVRAAKDMKARVSADDAWHLKLVSGCNNQVLLGLVGHFMYRLRRYSLAFGRERRVLEARNREHLEIMRGLSDGDLEYACEWLRKNLTSDKQPILEWLDEREKEEVRSA